MKKLLTASVLALGCWAGAAQAAPTITFTAGGSTLPTGTSVFQNFESYSNGQLLPGATNAYATNTSVMGTAYRPANGSTGNYGAVLGNGSYTVSFGGAAGVSLFSFVLGSLDSFNTLTLNFANGTSTTYTGAQIVSPMGTAASSTVANSGSTTLAANNGVVSYSILDGGPLITGATFGSTQNAFEIDNLSAVPEPAAWGMMILGFGLVGGVMRRRQSAKVGVRFA